MKVSTNGLRLQMKIQEMIHLTSVLRKWMQNMTRRKKRGRCSRRHGPEEENGQKVQDQTTVLGAQGVLVTEVLHGRMCWAVLGVQDQEVLRARQALTGTRMGMSIPKR